MAVDLRVGRGDPRVLLSTLAQSLLVVFVAFLSAYAVAALGGNLLVSTGVLDTGGLAIRVVGSVLQFVGFGIGVWLYLWFRDRVDLVQVRLPTLTDLAWMAAGIVLILVAAAVVGGLLQRFGVDVASNQVIQTGRENPQYFLYMIPVSLLFVGPFEELVFRGTVQGLLRETYGPAVAIGLASALFGIVHWVALTGSGSRIWYMAVAAALGLILGYVYERTSNLVVPAVVHGVYNSVLFVVQYAMVTGLLPS
jgi:hypothetical protein